MTDLCSTLSREHDEPLTATASRVERWLLVEHHGAWGPQSVPMARIPHQLARALAVAANTAQARLVLIRRPHARGSDRPTAADGRWVFLADSRPGAERLLARHVDTDDALTRLLPTGLPFGGDDPGWQQQPDRLWLVCTHGRHDRCCAVRGRPVAQALRRRHPQTTWECTHIGGDRFAANVVVLPEGLFLGKVEADEVVALADDLDAGRLPPGRLRGRSSLSLPAQAAQHFAREATDRWGSQDLLPWEQTGAGAHAWWVGLRGPGGPDVEVVVAYDSTGDGDPRLLTCGAGEVKQPPLFRLVSMS